MKKRIISALLVAAMAASLAACGGSSKPAEQAPAATDEKKDDAQAPAATDIDWPTKNVNVTVPYKAGGDTDLYCRALFAGVSEKLGQTFVVTNMEGGSGLVAAMDVQTKKNDGYTLLFNHTGASLVQEATGKATFSYTNDYANVCTVAADRTYALCAVSSTGEYKQYNLGFDDLNGMVEYAKANPGAVRYSTVSGSTTEYVGKMIMKDAGVQFDMLDVGTSAGDRLAALMGGHIDLVAINYINVADYIEKGDLVCLGIMSTDRVAGIDFPTFTEQGMPSVVSEKKYEVKFPKGTDPAIVAKLADVCKQVVESDSFKETLTRYYAEPLFRDAETMNTEDPAEVEALKAALAQ